jgi:hypothetical protein
MAVKNRKACPNCQKNNTKKIGKRVREGKLMTKCHKETECTSSEI